MPMIDGGSKQNREALLKRGIGLEYATLGWNVVGVAVVIFAALQARSVALAGFGLDSLIEIGASTVVLWELTGTGHTRQKTALRLIGGAFLLLALYILVQSARTLYLHQHPHVSPLGMTWLGATFVVMVALAQNKRITGTQLDNPVLLTEGRVTMVDAYLAASVLVGLVLNALLGWWWADPLAGLVIVFYGVKEGLHAWAEASEQPPLMEKFAQVAKTLKRELRVYQAIACDVRTPRAAKLLLGCAIGYALMPFDLIPDFVPVIGHLDDLIIVPGLVIAALRFVPPVVVADCRKQVKDAEGMGK